MSYWRDFEFYTVMVDFVATGIAIALVVRSGRRVRGGGRDLDIPRCARCHYGLVNMPSAICPECGSDVAVGGVLTPGAVGFPRLRWLALWVLLCAALFYGVVQAITYCVRTAEGNEEIEFRATNERVARSTGVMWCKRATLSYRGEIVRLSARPLDLPVDRATLLLETEPTPIQIAVEGNPARYRITGDGHWYAFSAADVMATLAARGVNTGDGDVLADASAFVGVLGDAKKAARLEDAERVGIVSRKDWLDSSSGHTSYQIIPLGTAEYPLVLGLWTMGMIWILPRSVRAIRGQDALRLTGVKATVLQVPVQPGNSGDRVG